MDNVTQLIRELAQSWRDRPADMKAIDEARDKDPEWFQSNKMLGGVCYVDRYANNLEGVKARIPYFQELGLTYHTIYVDFDKNEQKSPEHVALNPNGRIPTIIDHKNGDLVLWYAPSPVLF